MPIIAARNYNANGNGNEVNLINSNGNDNGIVDQVASTLVEEFGSPGSRKFYCKVAHSLPDSVIYRLVAEAKECSDPAKGSPAKLFNFLARKEMTS